MKRLEETVVEVEVIAITAVIEVEDILKDKVTKIKGSDISRMIGIEVNEEMQEQLKLIMKF